MQLKEKHYLISWSTLKSYYISLQLLVVGRFSKTTHNVVQYDNKPKQHVRKLIRLEERTKSKAVVFGPCTRIVASLQHQTPSLTKLQQFSNSGVTGYQICIFNSNFVMDFPVPHTSFLTMLAIFLDMVSLLWKMKQ